MEKMGREIDTVFQGLGYSPRILEIYIFFGGVELNSSSMPGYPDQEANGNSML